jgi:hypothetical protein
MADIITTPSTGQPIDTQYISDIANALNTINANINTSKNSRITGSSFKTSDLKIWTGVINVLNTTKVTTSTLTPVSVTFDGISFTNTPVVTATICNSSSNTTKPIISMGIPSSTQVNFSISYTSSGTASYSLHVIAIGY